MVSGFLLFMFAYIEVGLLRTGLKVAPAEPKQASGRGWTSVITEGNTDSLRGNTEEAPGSLPLSYAFRYIDANPNDYLTNSMILNTR